MEDPAWPAPLDPALTTPIPERRDAAERPDEVAAAATMVRPGSDVLAPLENLQARPLSDAGLIDALVACQRQVAAIEAKAQEFLAEVGHRDSDGKLFLGEEVGPALRLAPATAREKVDVAQALTGRLWDTRELIYYGHLSAAHGRILANATELLSDEVVAKVQAQVLPRAPLQTPGEFRASVRRAIAYHDRANEAERHQEAVTRRRVVREPAADGMSWIHLFLPDDGAATVMTAINAWATTTGPDDERTADQRRADAAVEIALAALAMPGLGTGHGLRPTVNVTLAASTLAGTDEQPGYVNGEPVPAELARRLARDASARRYHWVVDSAGRILDRTCPHHPATTKRTGTTKTCAAKPDTATGCAANAGAATGGAGTTECGAAGGEDSPLRALVAEAYKPPAHIARHVITRDQHCVMPGCRRTAVSCDLDHRTPWPDGATSAENLQAMCRRHHKMKHHSAWRVERACNGDYKWTSPTRHTYRYRPPEHPVPEPEPPPGTDNQPPPF